MHIREFTMEDYDKVVALWRAAGLTVGFSEAREGIRQKLERDPQLFLVAEEGDEIVGAVMGTYDGRRGYFYRLGVLPSRQGRGIGSALVEEVERRLAAMGCKKINVLVVEDNERAKALYRKLGYSLAPVDVMIKEL